MSDVNLPSGNPDEQPVADQKDKNVVSYETYQKVLSEKKSVQSKLQELEGKFLETEKAQRLLEESKLNEKGEFKKLFELKEQELKLEREKNLKLEKEKDSYKGSLDDTYKLNAFYDKLPGKIKRQEYLNFVDLDSIIINPETGNVDPTSVQNVVASFVENYSDLIKPNDFGRLPGDAPKGSNRKYTISEWKSLSLKEQKENWARRPAV